MNLHHFFILDYKNILWILDCSVYHISDISLQG